MSRRFGWLAILCVFYSAAWGDEAYLRFGLFPYVNPAKLIEHHKAFVEQLEADTHSRIQIITSPNFNTFLQRTRNNEFDIILTAPHFGRLAERESGYRRVAMTSHQVQGIYVVKADSEIASLSQLEGARITIAAPTSILYKLAKRQLREEYGLIDGKNITIDTTGTHNNAMYAVIKGESDAAVTGHVLFENMLRERGPVLKQIGATKAVPGFMIMANKQLPESTLKALRRSALNFSATESGRGYVFQGYKEIDDETMKMLDAYTLDER